MQTPCDEGSVTYQMIVGQSAAVEGGHEKNVGIWPGDSHQSRRADCQSAAGCQPAPHSSKPQTVPAIFRRSQRRVEGRQAD